MTVPLIVTQDEFEEFCLHVREAGTVAFDTEFISENTYQPQLCLLQFATADRTAAVDPFEVRDLSLWWQLMTDEATTVITHGGQAEIRFCLHYAGQAPRKFVDVQMAEGLRSRSYPLAYATLVNRVLDRRVHGKETRTNWHHRPLSKAQIQYALEDVKYVLAIWEKQRASLARLGRLEWAHAEFDRMVDEIAAEHVREAWHRLPKLHKLSPREMAVVRELSLWREAEAARRDRPPRRILRDDLVLELAKRQPTTSDELFATRDMNRGDLRGIGPGNPRARRTRRRDSRGRAAAASAAGRTRGRLRRARCRPAPGNRPFEPVQRAQRRQDARWNQRGSPRPGPLASARRKESAAATAPGLAGQRLRRPAPRRADRQDRPPRGRQQVGPSAGLRAARRSAGRSR